MGAAFPPRPVGPREHTDSAHSFSPRNLRICAGAERSHSMPAGKMATPRQLHLDCSGASDFTIVQVSPKRRRRGESQPPFDDAGERPFKVGLEAYNKSVRTTIRVSLFSVNTAIRK